MRLLHDNKIDGATLTPSSVNINYPVSNLKDTRLSRKWRTTGDEDESLLIGAGGAALEVFRATTNIIDDPEDMTAASWLEADSTATLTDLYYDSKRFTKVLASAATGRVYQALTFTGDGVKAVSVIAKYGDDTTSQLVLRDITAAAFRLEMTITWATKVITETTGSAHRIIWLDDETVWLFCITTAVTAANVNHIRLISPVNTKHSYFTAAQAEDLICPTPYVNGVRAVTHPDETFEMPSQFTVDMIVRPWFTYDSAVAHRFVEWYIDVNHRSYIYFLNGNDKIRFQWKDGGTDRVLESQVFDDGSVLTDINQRIRITVSIDLTTGDTSGSRLIVEPLEVGAIAEDTVWSGAIDAHTTTYPILSIGHENDLSQADSQIEYIRIYDGTLVGTVTDSDDTDALLAEKNLLLDLTYLDRITANYALIAEHNISAGASIKLQGNDYDAWDGPPFEEAMAWNGYTIIHALTEIAYPFWRFLIDDPNNHDGIFKIGRPFLGTYYQVLETFEKNFTESPFNTDVARYSMSGQMYSRRGYDGKQYSLNFPYWENSVKQAVETIVVTVGKRKPFFLMLDENNPNELPIFYCHIPEDPQYPHIVNYIWQASLVFREVK